MEPPFLEKYFQSSLEDLLFPAFRASRILCSGVDHKSPMAFLHADYWELLIIQGWIEVAVLV